MSRKKRILRICLFAFLGLILVGSAGVLGINAHVQNSVKDRILTVEEAAQLQGVDCILVLGCGVRDDGTPSAMLKDRLRRGVELYDAGAAPKLLMSGDHGREGYDEVNVMKQAAVDAGVDSGNVFMDHAGFSTYESLYRAQAVFRAEKIIIVTQEYHLYRAMYIARELGLEVYGVASDYRNYANASGRELREVLARCKDFASCVFRPEPTYLGEAIPIGGDGNLTNDENSDFM